ncbi:hypothetical protein GCM10023322_44780 [Rugosimonospora acidiphila]|uniref:Uncharacterized protein n=1 Tax=Rugosimonospora acidiphila TaxID=556531 RepID=A0ABP9S2R0_9ACTN
MVDPGDRPRLTQRPNPQFLALLLGQAGRRNDFFDCHVPLQHRVPGPPYATHSTLTDNLAENVPIGNIRPLYLWHGETVPADSYDPVAPDFKGTIGTRFLAYPT